MKSSPTPPTPPDPTTVSTAQGTADVNTAIAQASLNHVNQVTPYGNLNYSTTGSQEVTMPDGSKISIPTYTATQNLTPTGQKTVDQQQQAQLGLATLANDQTGRVASTLSTPLTFSGLPSMATGIDTKGLTQVPTGVDNSQMAALPTGADLSRVDALPQGINTGFATNGVPKGVNMSALGLLPTGVNQSALPQQVSGLDKSALPQMPNSPTDMNNSVAQAMYANAQSFMQPGQQQAQTDLNDRLAQQGIPVGSEAWTNAQKQLSNSQNQQNSSALNNAIVSGAQQGSTDYGLALQGVNTGVGVQTANAGLANQAGNFGLAAQGLNSNIANQAVTQSIGAQTANAGVANQAAQTGIGAQVASAGQADQAASLGLQGQQLNGNLALAGNQFNLQSQAQSAAMAQQSNQDQLQQQTLSAQLAQAARQQGISEQQYLYNLPINQTSALLSGSQVQGPQFVNTPQTTVNPTNVLGAYALNQQGQQANYQSQVAAQSAGLGGAFGLAGAGLSAAGNAGSFGALFSSRDFKQDNEPVDTAKVLESVSRMPVERWKYKDGIADGARHMGPYAEDFAREFGGDGKTIDVISMIGALTASVQELTTLVKEQGKRLAVLEAA